MTIKESTTLEKQKQIKDKITEIKNSIHAYDLKKQEKSNFISRRDQLVVWLDMLEHDLAELEQSAATNDTVVDEQRTRINTIKADIERTKEELNTLDIVDFV